MLSGAQRRRIENILQENRRDPTVIAAILYREFSGQSLRHAAEVFGITRVSLHDWHQAIEADGSLAKVMAALKLEPAGPLVRRPWWPALLSPRPANDRPGH